MGVDGDLMGFIMGVDGDSMDSMGVDGDSMGFIVLGYILW